MRCRKENGLSRRFAPRNDMQKLAACAHGKDVIPGKFVTPHEFALSTAVLLCPAARRSGLPRRCAPRNDNGGTSLHPPARSRVPHTLRAKRPCTRAHVLSSACHCEPVRTLVWQSASPQRGLASWLLFWQIRSTFRICLKYCSLLCAAARRTDCPVASLLAIITCFHTTINENVIYWRRGRSSLSYPRSGRSTTI